MKKLLMGAVCLSIFAIALSLIQISCSKSDAQSSIKTTSPVNKILFKEELPGGSGHVIKFAIMNNDGTGLQYLNIPFPAGFSDLTGSLPSLSPDAKKIFFAGRETAFTTAGIYSCDTSGANLTRIANCSPNSWGFVSGAY